MNIIPFPQSPFFCADEGGCLPTLTAGQSVERDALAEVEIDFAVMEQRVQIEEELLKLKLRNKCFVALATECPKSVVQGPSSDSDLSQATVRGTDPAHNQDQRGATPRPATKCSIKVFPGAYGGNPQVQSGSASGISPNRFDVSSSNSNNPAPTRTGFGVFPGGRW